MKAEEYAVIISQKISELFDEESESDLKINFEELKDDENMTCFIHALTNLMPAYFYTQLTGDNKDSLEFNHIANRLVFKYSKQIKS